MDYPAVLYGEYLPTATAVATDNFPGTTAAKVLQATEDTFWRPADTVGAKAVTIDLGEIRSCNRLCLLGEPLDGMLVDVFASTDNFSASNVPILAGQTLAAAVNAATLSFLTVSFRYWRVIFQAGFIPSPFRLAHLLFGKETVLPWFETDFDPDTFEVTGEILISTTGLFLGNNIERSMRAFPLRWGQVTDYDYATIKPWAMACVGRLPFFLLPDTATTDCQFGWIAGKFSAPRNNGLYTVAPLTFTTRAA